MPLKPSKPLTWLITGTSQGFGRDLVAAALARGDSVVATSRSPEKVQAAFPDVSDRLLPTAMDFRDASQIASVIQSAIKRFGQIDVLINNAGHGLLAQSKRPVTLRSQRSSKPTSSACCESRAPCCLTSRQRRSGHIVNLSSIGGLIGIPGWGIYNATKFAVEGISEALAQELNPLGIGVTIVEPGPFRTDFLGGSLATVESHLPDYDQTAGKTRTYQKENDGSQAGNPKKSAKAIVDAVTGDNPPLHLLLGAMAYQRANQKLDALRAEFEKWRAVTLATDFPK